MSRHCTPNCWHFGPPHGINQKTGPLTQHACVSTLLAFMWSCYRCTCHVIQIGFLHPVETLAPCVTCHGNEHTRLTETPSSYRSSDATENCFIYDEDTNYTEKNWGGIAQLLNYWQGTGLPVLGLVDTASFLMHIQLSVWWLSAIFSRSLVKGMSASTAICVVQETKRQKRAADDWYM